MADFDQSFLSNALDRIDDERDDKRYGFFGGILGIGRKGTVRILELFEDGIYLVRVLDVKTGTEHVVRMTRMFGLELQKFMSDSDIDFKPGSIEVVIDLTSHLTRRGRVYTFRLASNRST